MVCSSKYSYRRYVVAKNPHYEKISDLAIVDDSLETVNRTALDFIVNPYARWALDGLAGKRLVLKATFSRALASSKDEGYRAAALSFSFLVLRDLSDRNSSLVEPRRVELLTSCVQSRRSTN